MSSQANAHLHQVITRQKRGPEGEADRMTGPYPFQQILKDEVGRFIISKAKRAIPQIQMFALHPVIGRNDLVFLID